MKKQLSLAMAAAMALSLAACGGSQSGSAAETTSTSGATSEEAASWGDVTLTMWGAEEDQTMLREMADAFIEENKDKGNITINIGACSEADAKDNVLTDPTAAADVYAFADDQLNELVAAGALQEVTLNADDVKSRNLEGSVEAASLNGKLYAYPMTADNGYFLYYDSSVITPEDAETVDGILAAAAAAGRTFDMTLNDGWYIYSFFAGAGLEATLAEDGVNTVCNWNEEPVPMWPRPSWTSPPTALSSALPMLTSFPASRTAPSAPPSAAPGTPRWLRRPGATTTPPPSCPPTP